MSKVTLAELPQQSLLWKRVAKTDFLDCYCVESTMQPRQAAQVITSFPGWVQFLLTIRRVVTTPFGLSNDGPESDDKMGIFPVESETSHELIAGFNDKHLNFRVSVISQKGRVFLATWVHTHNLGGRLYLKAILPFHILIARESFARVQAENVVA